MKPVDEIQFWRDKCGEYEALYRKQKDITKVYKSALEDLMAYDDDKRKEAKEKVRTLENDLL